MASSQQTNTPNAPAARLRQALDGLVYMREDVMAPGVATTSSGPRQDALRTTHAARPWSRTDYLRRLGTFSPGTWFGTPRGVGVDPSSLAQRGWRLRAHGVIACEACGHQAALTLPAEWPFARRRAACADFAKSLDDAHEPGCAWKGSVCGEDVVAFPPSSAGARQEAFRQRLAPWNADGAPAVPSVDVPAALRCAGCSTDEDASNAMEKLATLGGAGGSNAAVLAACGWELADRPYRLKGSEAANAHVLHCSLCNATQPLWLFAKGGATPKLRHSVPTGTGGPRAAAAQVTSGDDVTDAEKQPAKQQKQKKQQKQRMRLAVAATVGSPLAGLSFGGVGGASLGAAARVRSMLNTTIAGGASPAASAFGGVTGASFGPDARSTTDAFPSTPTSISTPTDAEKGAGKRKRADDQLPLVESPPALRSPGGSAPEPASFHPVAAHREGCPWTRDGQDGGDGSFSRACGIRQTFAALSVGNAATAAMVMPEPASAPQSRHEALVKVRALLSPPSSKW